MFFTKITLQLIKFNFTQLLRYTMSTIPTLTAVRRMDYSNSKSSELRFFLYIFNKAAFAVSQYK